MKVYSYVDKTRANADGTFPVYVIVSNKQGRFFINTGMTSSGRLIGGRVFPKETRSASKKTTLLGKYLADVESVCLQQALSGADNKTLKSVIQREVFGIVKKEKVVGLYERMLEFAETKREVTRHVYEVTARKVLSFDGKATLESTDESWLSRFYDSLLNDGMSVNGASKDMRNIRAVFNWCRKKGYTSNYPFLDYPIRQEETTPNNISVEVLRKLRNYPCEEWQKIYVDFFFLSFYLAGINPVDLLLLKKENVKGSHVTFVRRKTDKEGSRVIRKVTLPLLPVAKEIIKRYPSKEGWFAGFMDGRNDYHSFVRAANDALRKVGKSWKVKDKAGKLRKMAYRPVCDHITLYSARYSFGSIAANDLDISERTIGMCLGHSWAKQVTARYIAHDQRRVDQTVKKVVDYFLGK